MALNLATIDHGDPNWDAKENSNFKALGRDTGWITVPLLNIVDPSGGSYLLIRRRARQLDIDAQFSVANAGLTKVADIPVNMTNSYWRYFVGFAIATGPIQFKIDDNHNLNVSVPADCVNTQIILDVSIASENR